MHRIYLIVALLTLTAQAYAQPGARIQGKIVDTDGRAIAFANVILFDAGDSTLVKTGFSAENGTFTLAPLTAGTYRLRAEFTGLDAFVSEALSLAADQNLILPDISLAEMETELDEVEIVAKKPLVEVKPDMTVFNVAGNAIAVGETAFELLRKAPGVLIDNNDNVLLMGKSGVRIYIDGKPSPLSVADLATMLKSMQSDQIESIEIITNPSAKYDAEGNAGIINIRLKKDQSLGTNANLSLGYAIGRYSKYNGGLNFNSRSKKVNVFGNYSGGIGTSFNFMEFYRIQNATIFDQRTDHIRDFTNHNLKLGTDIFLNEQHTIGVMFNGFVNDGMVDMTSRTQISDEASGQDLSILQALNQFEQDNNNLNFNLNYAFQTKAGTRLNVDADYGRFRIRSDSYQPNFYLSPTTGDTLSQNIFAIYTPTEIDIYTLKADYERSLGKGKLSAGAKVAWIETDNDFNFSDVIEGNEILNTDRSNQFVYQENINAAYATYQQQLDKWNVEVGLRAEQTRTRGELISVQQTGLDTVDREYLNLFPTAGVTYAPNQAHSFRVNYSRRIDRPRYQDLNPFVTQLDQLTFQQGNPFLRPQYTHSVQLTHTFKYRYTTSVSYSMTNDFFTQITDTFSTEASFISQQNLASREVIAANFSAPISFTKWYSTYTNLNVSRTRNLGDFNLPGETGKDVDVARTTFNIFQQHTFTLPGNIILEVSGFYNSPSIWGANYLTADFWGINTGAQIRFWENKANLKLSLTDIFYSMQWQGTQNFGGLFFDAMGGWESRQFKVNFTFDFGNDKVKAARRRRTGIQDESNRASGGGSGPGGN